MPYLNKVEVMGNLGKDPELRYLPNGKATTTLSIAYAEKWRDRETNDLRERIEWFTAVLYDKQAETVCKYMKKGDCIFVIGKFQSRIYKDRQQIERIAHEIIVAEMQIIHTRQPSAAAPTGLPDYL